MIKVKTETEMEELEEQMVKEKVEVEVKEEQMVKVKAEKGEVVGEINDSDSDEEVEEKR